MPHGAMNATSKTTPSMCLLLNVERRSIYQVAKSLSTPYGALDMRYARRKALEETIDRLPSGSLVFPGFRLRPGGVQRHSMVRDAREHLPRRRRRVARPRTWRRSVHEPPDRLGVGTGVPGGFSGPFLTGTRRSSVWGRLQNAEV